MCQKKSPKSILPGSFSPLKKKNTHHVSRIFHWLPSAPIVGSHGFVPCFGLHIFFLRPEPMHQYRYHHQLESKCLPHAFDLTHQPTGRWFSIRQSIYTPQKNSRTTRVRDFTVGVLCGGRDGFFSMGLILLFKGRSS